MLTPTLGRSIPFDHCFPHVQGEVSPCLFPDAPEDSWQVDVSQGGRHYTLWPIKSECKALRAPNLLAAKAEQLAGDSQWATPLRRSEAPTEEGSSWGELLLSLAENCSSVAAAGSAGQQAPEEQQPQQAAPPPAVPAAAAAAAPPAASQVSQNLNEGRQVWHYGMTCTRT